MLLLLLLWIFIGTVGFIAAVCVRLAVGAARIREALKIPAVPMLVPTSAEQVPAELAAFLAEVVPALSQLGFVAVASV